MNFFATTAVAPPASRAHSNLAVHIRFDHMNSCSDNHTVHKLVVKRKNEIFIKHAGKRKSLESNRIRVEAVAD